MGAQSPPDNPMPSGSKTLPMKFACPHCDQRIEAGNEFAGQVVDCPSCSGKITVPGDNYKYWAFLSYSHQDNITARANGRGDCVRWAEWLHNALETYRVPPGFSNHRTLTGESMPQRFFPVFQDEKELPINAHLGESIQQALRQSRFLIVICSPNAATSRYVNEEVRYFKQLGLGDRILALIVAGEPNASAGTKQGVPPELECFCPALLHPIGADGLEDLRSRDTLEPIAGDVRVKLAEPVREALQSDLRKGHQVVMELMKLKLLAGLMGVGFDELMQRDKVRAFAEARAHQTHYHPIRVILGCIPCSGDRGRSRLAAEAGSPAGEPGEGGAKKVGLAPTIHQ